MSGRRRVYMDVSIGETRAVVTLDGAPERLFILREGDDTPRLGAVYAARVEAVSHRMGLVRLDLGTAAGAMKPKRAMPPVGARLTVEVVAEPAHGKPARVRRLDPATTELPGLLQAAPPLQTLLARLDLPEAETGDEARSLADEAQQQVLAVSHILPGGLDISIEPTRALVAVDVDLAEGGWSAMKANVSALHQSARLLRLKALGGLVAIDLIGFPAAEGALRAEAAEAFAPDGPSVGISFPSRFGVIQVAKPRERQPLAEQLRDVDGRPSARTLAQATVRDLVRQARHAPGTVLTAPRAPAVAALADPLVRQLGPLYRVQADASASWTSREVRQA